MLYYQICLFRQADFFVQKLFPVKVANIKTTRSSAMHGLYGLLSIFLRALSISFPLLLLNFIVIFELVG